MDILLQVSTDHMLHEGYRRAGIVQQRQPEYAEIEAALVRLYGRPESPPDFAYVVDPTRKVLFSPIMPWLGAVIPIWL